MPDKRPDSEARVGVPLGPPPLTDLGLPLEVEVRLHNQLFDRGLIYERDARQRPSEVVSAVIAAYRVDASRVIGIYQGNGATSASKEK